MSDRPAPADLVHGVPPVAVSSSSTLANRTGSWKYIRPVYQDKIAPCNAACPVGIDLEGCLSLMSQGRTAEAQALLRRENPMPAVTGRLCGHPCEGACHRGRFDEAVGIHAVERALGDLDPGEPAPPVRARDEKVAIVGSGPAGLACAYHLARLGYAAHVYEAEAEPGGSLRVEVPEYRLPGAVLAREIAWILAHGVSIRCRARVGEDVPWEALDAYDAIFVATGANREPLVDVDGVNGADVRSGREFLRQVRAGGRRALGRRVAVLGATDVAVDCARTALRLGAEPVVLCACGRDEMAASAAGVGEALREGVRFEFHAHLVRLRTTDDPAEAGNAEAAHTEYEQGDGYRGPLRLQGLECVRAAAPGANGPPPARATGPRFVVVADTLLLAGEGLPDLDALPGGVARRGTALRVDEFGQTERAGLFAGGEAAGEPRTLAHALGSGKRAAIGIDRWLSARSGESVAADDSRALRYGGSGNFSITRWRGDDPVERTNERNEVVAFDCLKLAHFARSPAHGDRVLAPGERAGGFAEVNLGLAPADALAEARRCFHCGVCNMCELCMIFCPDLAIQRHAGGRGFSLSYKYCKGCGLCVEECPRDAMTMTREGL